MKFNTIIAAALSSLVISSAFAADLPKKTSAPSLLSPQKVSDWSGAYVGGSIGFASSEVKHTDLADDDRPVCLFDLCGDVRDTGGNSLTGFVNAGVNWQFGQTVIGAEADYGVLDASGRSLPFDDPNEFLTSNIDALASVRGRVGAVLDQTFIYVTAGAAFADMDTESVYGNFGQLSVDGWRSGWVAGAGLEHAIDNNWSVRAEGLYYDFGRSEDYFDMDDPANNSIGYHETVDTSVIIARIGLNYKF